MIILNCPTIPNLRDLGGTAAADGRRICRGYLLRSAHLGNASDEDVRYLMMNYRLRTIIDLRTKEESKVSPDRADGCRILEMPIIRTFEAGITHEATTENMPFPDLAVLYRNMMLDRGCQEGFRAVLETCFSNDYGTGSVLWHCSEGKDRCGMTAALVLEALGVSRSEILRDYLETNTTNLLKAKAMKEKEERESGDEARAASIYQAYVADEQYIRNAWDAMGRNYLTECLGFSQQDLEDFRNRVLEPAE